VTVAVYPIVPLREVCESIDYGYTASATTEPVGPRFLRITDIVPERLDWSGVPFCEIEPQKLAKHRLRTGDIVIARTGATTGWAKFIKNPPEAVFASYLVRIRPSSSVDARFVGCIVESRVYKDFIQQHMGGAAQPNANAQVLTSYEIPLPPLQVQQRIADILTTYDELIENNQRRILILEEMARALYREWFVEFRFPGNERGRRVASPVGEIPEGWEVRRLKDVVSVVYGFPFQSKAFNTAGIGAPVVRIRDIPEGISKTFTDEVADPKYHIKNGHILVGMDGDFHICIWSGDHAYQNQRVARFESNGEIGCFQLFFALEKPIQEFNKAIVGTTVGHLGDMHIKTIQIIWPPAKFRAKAREILDPMSNQIIALKGQIRNLRRTRDLLLPRLLSGQVAIGSSAMEGRVLANARGAARGKAGQPARLDR
jgi:type I restriction enzyme S subunit